MVAWLALLGTASACPSFDRLVVRATDALLVGDVPTASATLAEAEAAMGCQPIGTDQLARFWMTEGVAMALAGAPDADQRFAAARRVSPGVWDPRFGRELTARFDAATETGRATLDLDTGRDRARVDGRAVEAWPAAVSSGLHLVQVVEEEVRYARILALAPGEDALVATGLPEAGTATLPPPPEAPAPRAKKSPALLVAAAGAAALGGGAAAGSWAYGRELEAAGSDGSLDAAWTLHRGLAYGAYGLWGLAGVGLVVHVALPAPGADR